jgi:hypothetical protein
VKLYNVRLGTRGVGHFARVHLPALRTAASRSEVIVSLTTYPGRVRTAWRTVESLLRQSVTPQKVVLVLSEEEFPGRELPRRFEAQRARGLDVMWIPRNLRCYQKLIPVLACYPSDVIVTADDDVFYPTDWLHGLLVQSAQTPGWIIGYRALELPCAQDIDKVAWSDWPQASDRTSPERVFLTGVSGVLYPPGSLASIALDVDRALELCPTDDDIWAWAMASLVHTRRAVISHKHGSEFPPSILKRNPPGLQDINIKEDQDIVQFKRILDHFELWAHLADGSSGFVAK